MMDNSQSVFQQMLNEDKQRGTLKLLASLTRLKLNEKQVSIIGGGQQFSHRNLTTLTSSQQQQMISSPSSTNLSIRDLPDDFYFYLFSFLSPLDLCQISNVCKQWYRLATDDTVWRQRLMHDIKYWQSISSRSNPLHYALVQSDRSKKESYLTCSPHIRRCSNQIDDSLYILLICPIMCAVGSVIRKI